MALARRSINLLVWIPVGLNFQVITNGFTSFFTSGPVNPLGLGLTYIGACALAVFVCIKAVDIPSKRQSDVTIATDERFMSNKRTQGGGGGGGGFRRMSSLARADSSLSAWHQARRLHAAAARQEQRSDEESAVESDQELREQRLQER
ncbi:hypothetical protein OIO90_004501 [Microbotryomycetes sp. JL221]|nr:hypothetical protein OIO90_004501 [Microbotryomycetes sp. JL221]